MRRMFGEFECKKCKNFWSSGNAWEGMGQQCLKCKAMIFPYTLEPLKPSEGSSSGAHIQKYCQMCQKLGRNCRDINDLESGPPSDDDDDAESVVSTISTVSDVSASTLTPTEGSSEESSHSGSDTEDELAADLSKLRFPK